MAIECSTEKQESGGLEQKIGLIENNLQRQIDWIKQHDQKSSIIFGITVAMTGFLAKTWQGISTPTIDLKLAFGLALLSLAGVFLLLYKAGFPRIKGPDSLIFFGTIAKFSAEDYVKKLDIIALADLAEDLARQCHSVSVIAEKKYALLQMTYRLILFSILPWAYLIAASVL